MRRNSHSGVRKSVLALGCFSAVLLLGGCVDRAVKYMDSDGKNIVCFGDSITLGYGVEPGQDYPSLLGKMTRTPVINAGIDGETSTEAVKRVGSDVLDKNPVLVIIEFGGNDFLSKVPLEETVRNIEKMVSQIQARKAMVAIADISANMVMDEYGKELRLLSKKYGAIFIPKLLEGIITNHALKSDFIHPNATGYKIVAHRIYRAILPYINRNLILNKFKNEILK